MPEQDEMTNYQRFKFGPIPEMPYKNEVNGD